MRYLFLALSIPLLGCSSETAPTSPDGGAGGPSPTVEPLPWTDCEWFTVPLPAGTADSGPAQCATLNVPLRRDIDIGTIEIFVKRLSPTVPQRVTYGCSTEGPAEWDSQWSDTRRPGENVYPTRLLRAPSPWRGAVDPLDCAGEADGSPNGFSLTSSEYVARWPRGSAPRVSPAHPAKVRSISPSSSLGLGATTRRP